MSRKKGSHDISHFVRANGRMAIKKLAEKKGISTQELFMLWCEDDWVAFMNMLGKHAVQQKQVTKDVKHNHTFEDVSKTSEWIAGIIGDSEEKQAKEPVTH